MQTHAERGMSAPPEVVYNTAIDPHRASAWLPEPLRSEGKRSPDWTGEYLRARWSSSTTPDWSMDLAVQPQDSGGALVRLDITGPDDTRLAEVAKASLTQLASEVAENLTAG